LRPRLRGSMSSMARTQPLDRAGVFFDNDAVPATGILANRRSTAEQLRDRIASWTLPFSPGPLSEKQLTQYFEKGWVIVDGVVDVEVIDEAVEAVEGLVDSLAHKLHRAGKISDLCESAPFEQRLIQLEEQFPHTSVLLHKNGVLPRGIQRVWSNPGMIAVAKQILGQNVDIMGHPVWNLRCKTPERLSGGQATVPWHQDNSYLDEECWDEHQLTAWVPLVDATRHNGCMQVVEGGHLPGVTANHACCVGGTWYTEVTPEELEATLQCDMHQDVVTCEVPRGSALFLNNIVPHRSTPNLSDGVRWSLDLRWQRASEPNGFHGLKDSVLMAKGGVAYDGNVEWGDWADEDRTQLQTEALSDAEKQTVRKAGEAEGRFDKDPDFDTTIAGPWMHTWDLIHHNRHTANLDPEGGMHGWGGDALKKKL